MPNLKWILLALDYGLYNLYLELIGNYSLGLCIPAKRRLRKQVNQAKKGLIVSELGLLNMTELRILFRSFNLFSNLVHLLYHSQKVFVLAFRQV